MSTMTMCPRGHDLEPNAVYCTVCWMRVEPEDPQIAAARMRRRRRIWLPLFGAGAVLIGVSVGGVLATSAPPAAPVVAAPAASVEPEPAEAAEAAAPETPVDAAVEPLAATVSEAPGSAGQCTAEVRDGSAACSLEADVATVVVCVPENTATITQRSRATEDDPWAETTQELVPVATVDCVPGRTGAALDVDTSDPSALWKVVSRDAAGDRLWRSPLAITIAAP